MLLPFSSSDHALLRAELIGLGSGLEISDCFCPCAKLELLLNTQSDVVLPE